VWTEGSRSVLHVPIDGAIPFPITLELELTGFVAPSLSQSVSVSVNGTNATVVKFDVSRPNAIERIEINAEDLSPDCTAEIAIQVANPTAPADVGASSDRRKLGVALCGLRIS
jgi:hypothetical protein